MIGPFSYLSKEERETFELCRQASNMQHVAQPVDGGIIDVFYCGPPGAPGIVLSSPLGVSSLFFAGLVRHFSTTFRVVMWERRGLYPPVPESIDGDEALRQRQLNDMQEAMVVAGVGKRVRAVVSYCSGCYVALLSVIRGLLEAPRLLCLIGPPLEIEGLDSSSKTLYQNTFVPLLERIAESGPSMAGLVRAIMARADRPEHVGIDAELFRLNDQPFAGAEDTYRYARLHHAWRRLDWSEMLANISARVLVLHGGADDMVHEGTVRALCGRLANATLEVYPGEGHFAVYQSDALIAKLVQSASAYD